jgi:hypothetical protein
MLRPTLLVLLAITAGCPSRRTQAPKVMPTPSVQVGSCGEPGRDGVMSAKPKIDRADRDLDGDGRNESIVVDRALCTAEGNCYWNVFVGPSPVNARGTRVRSKPLRSSRSRPKAKTT